MNAVSDVAVGSWSDALLAAALFAVDPVATSGIVVRSHAGPVRDVWLSRLRRMMPDTAFRRLPLSIGDDRLLGGLDLAASLRAGHAVADPGLLAQADGGVLLVSMAERLPGSVAARLASVLDTGETALERDGLAMRLPARLGIVALDEGLSGEEQPPAALLDRLAFRVDLTGVAPFDAGEEMIAPEAIAAARAALPSVACPEAIVGALSGAAMALGVASLRAPILALRVARIAAAMAGRAEVTPADAAAAARLVLAPRATRLPQSADADEASPLPEESSGQEEELNDARQGGLPPDEVVLAAARAAIPAQLLAGLRSGVLPARTADAFGRAGQMARTRHRGRPAGTRRGEPRNGARLDILETLRAAAPWQPLRRRERATATEGQRLEIRRDDFRIRRFKQHTETTAIFVVDASGSAAFRRLAEVKGAVELMLAECYVRRDRVALIAFRGSGAELLLPPTRSLSRAKRNLAELPGGGQTPLAAGIAAALVLADGVKRSGRVPAIVLMTDGGANMTLDGATDKPRAMTEALAAARRVSAGGHRAILIDTSPRPRAAAEMLASAMSAPYIALPHAGSASLSGAVLATVEAARRGASG